MRFLNKTAKDMPKSKRDGDYRRFFKDYLSIDESEIQNIDPHEDRPPKDLALKLLNMWKERTCEANEQMLNDLLDQAVKDRVFHYNWHRGGM